LKMSENGTGSGSRRLDVQAKREMATLFGRRARIFIAVFALMAILFQIQSSGVFLTPRNLSLLLRQGAILAVVAGGVALLMIMAEIDLSIGSAVFLCGVFAAKLSTNTGLPLFGVVLATVLLGMLLGGVQGVWVVFLGIPSFIATLAGLLAFRGIGLLWTNAATVGPVPSSFIALSENFISRNYSYITLGAILVTGIALVVIQQLLNTRARSAAGIMRPPTAQSTLLITAKSLVVAVPIIILAWIVGGFQGIPMALVWVGVIVTLLTVLLGRTVFGRSAYLVGANREAAIYSGINLKRTVFTGFLIMGALYGVVGVLLTARLGSSTPGAGEFMELDAIAAAVIGGVSLRGGTGTVVGAVMGAFLLTVINNGMSILNISSFTQLVIKAAILIVALGFDSFALRRASR
jgi:D-xylose transport system permease protein